MLDDDVSGFGIWFRVLSVNAAIIIGWIIFYDPVINYLLVEAVASPGVPDWFEDRFKMFWYFWPIALMFATVIWGILSSSKRDFYEYGGGYYG